MTRTRILWAACGALFHWTDPLTNRVVRIALREFCKEASASETPEPGTPRRRRTEMHDPAARRRWFEELAAEVYEPLQRYARRRVAAASVDDVVSETMTTLWKRLDDIPSHAALPWAYGVARRQIANHRRGVRRHLRLVQRLEAEPLTATNSDTPLDPELEQALTGLGESDREILRLWAWEQLEAAEIATVMGLTANAASIRLHRAKKKLSENLEAERKNRMSSGHRPGERRKEERR